MLLDEDHRRADACRMTSAAYHPRSARLPTSESATNPMHRSTRMKRALTLVGMVLCTTAMSVGWSRRAYGAHGTGGAGVRRGAYRTDQRLDKVVALCRHSGSVAYPALDQCMRAHGYQWTGSQFQPSTLQAEPAQAANATEERQLEKLNALLQAGRLSDEAYQRYRNAVLHGNPVPLLD